MRIFVRFFLFSSILCIARSDFDGDVDGIQTMGIVNAMKTGNIVMDMVVAMSIPLMLRFLFGMIGKTPMRLGEFLRTLLRPGKLFTRRVKHRYLRHSWGSSSNIDKDAQNQVLVKAIQLFLHHMGTLNLDHADLRLTSLEDNLDLRRRSYYDDDDDEDGASKKSPAASLAKFQIVHKPPERRWHSVGKFRCDGKTSRECVQDEELLIGEATTTMSLAPPAKLNEVKLMVTVEENEESKDSGSIRVDVTIELQSEGKKSNDAFVKTAYDWFLEELRKRDDNSRYLYEVCMDHESDSEKNKHETTYKRYKLSDEKTFDSLFFQEKREILSLIKHFTKKSGKYAIKGYPHKLGLLLHGPPGTGKTSLIKALAHHTGRSIVNVPLAKISTNEELMSIFFDRNYNVQGDNSGVPIKMGFKDVIFVMEDVDAASRVVRRRDGKRTASVSQREKVDVLLPPTKTGWQMLLESQDESCRELVQILMEKSERLKKAALEGSVMQGLADRMSILPGLSLVGSDIGSGEDAVPAIEKMASESLERAQQVLDGYETIDKFTAANAAAIKALIDAGAEVDTKLENKLLGEDTTDAIGPTQLMKDMPALSLSRDVSYNKYQNDDVEKIEEDQGALLSALAGALTQADGGGKVSGSSGERSTTDGHNATGRKTVGTGLGDETNKSGVEAFPSGALSAWSRPKKDELNLTGLLNVLDGVVDTPGRILVMTTNHPEMLDPALIRPGRIDKKMVLGYMRPKDVVDMLEHYFQPEKLDTVQVERVERAICGNDNIGRPALNMTPAQIEQLAVEHDDIDDMIDALEKKGLPLHTPATATVANWTRTQSTKPSDWKSSSQITYEP